MKYKISKYFAQEVHKIKDRKILAKIKNCIDAIEKATDLADIPNLETLKGFPGYYRIKFDYSQPEEIAFVMVGRAIVQTWFRSEIPERSSWAHLTILFKKWPAKRYTSPRLIVSCQSKIF